MNEINKLKKEIRELKQEVNKLNIYRLKYFKLQGWVNAKFHWFIDLLSESNKPCLKYLIKDCKDILVETKVDR